MKKKQFKKITNWQKKTFGEATALSKIAHLKEEIKELETELSPSESNSDESVKEKELEFADCFILLFGAAASDGMSYKNICDCIDEKMQINYNRKWGKPKKNGVVNHIE